MVRHFRWPQETLGVVARLRIEDYAQVFNRWRQLPQGRQPLLPIDGSNGVRPVTLPPRVRQAFNISHSYGIADVDEYNRNGRSYVMQSRHRRIGRCNNDRRSHLSHSRAQVRVSSVSPPEKRYWISALAPDAGPPRWLPADGEAERERSSSASARLSSDTTPLSRSRLTFARGEGPGFARFRVGGTYVAARLTCAHGCFLLLHGAPSELALLLLGVPLRGVARKTIAPSRATTPTVTTSTPSGTRSTGITPPPFDSFLSGLSRPALLRARGPDPPARRPLPCAAVLLRGALVGTAGVALGCRARAYLPGRRMTRLLAMALAAVLPVAVFMDVTVGGED